MLITAFSTDGVPGLNGSAVEARKRFTDEVVRVEREHKFTPYPAQYPGEFGVAVGLENGVIPRDVIIRRVYEKQGFGRVVALDALCEVATLDDHALKPRQFAISVVEDLGF